jgi:hypothetical protein
LKDPSAETTYANIRKYAESFMKATGEKLPLTLGDPASFTIKEPPKED